MGKAPGEAAACKCGASPNVPADGGRFRCACGLIYDARDIDWHEPFPGPVKPGDFKREAPTPTTSWPVDWRLDPVNLERVRWGYKPRSMDDKWFIYAEGPEVCFHRSWSGVFCYRALLTPTGIREVQVATHMPNPEWHVKLVRWLVEHFLLGQESEMPV